VEEMAAENSIDPEYNDLAWLGFSQHCPYCDDRGCLERYHDDSYTIRCPKCGGYIDADADKGPPAEPLFTTSAVGI